MKSLFTVLISFAAATGLIWAVHILMGHGAEIKDANGLIIYCEGIVMGFLFIGMTCDKIIKYAVFIMKSNAAIQAGREPEPGHHDYSAALFIFFCATIISVSILVTVTKLTSIS